MMKKTTKTKRQIVRIGGLLKEIVTVHDLHGNILHKVINPLMLEFRSKDVIQVIIGATLLAVPVGFTEEVWQLGEHLPLKSILAIGTISLIFVGLFVYYHSYRVHLNGNLYEFIKRVASTYVITLIVVGIFLTLIQKAQWQTEYVIALKRIILVAFPASMSAAVADMIK